MEARLLNIRELGKYIGYSHETIRKQVRMGAFPIPSITGTGKRRRWDKVEVDQWIEAQKKKRDK